MDDHVHWLGQWQCAIMFPDKVEEHNPYGPDTLLRWLTDADQEPLLNQPVIRRLQDLHDALHDQAYELGQSAPRSRPPFESYAELLRDFDSFIAQLRRAERLVASAAQAGGLASLQSGKAMGVILREISELMQRAEAKGMMASLAVASVDNFTAIRDRIGAAAMDFAVAEVSGRIGHNLRPFDDVFRLEDAYSVWFLQQAKIEDAVKAADRVRRKITVLPVEFPDGTAEPVSISVSLVTVDYAAPPADLIARALDGLRTAQTTGINQVYAAELDAA